MESPEGDASPGAEPAKTPIQTAVDEFLEEFDAASTRRNYEAQLTEWTDWPQERGIVDVRAVDSAGMADYARHLAARSRGGELTGGTAHTYYSYVSAFLAWCVEWERLDTNQARKGPAMNTLPEDHGGESRQFWTAEAREALRSYVDDRAHDALESEEIDRRQAFRDRSIACVLALTGARGCEVFRDPADD
jgi:integrase